MNLRVLPAATLATSLVLAACNETTIVDLPDTDDTDIIDTDTDDTDLPPVPEEARFYILDVPHSTDVTDDGRVLLFDARTADSYLWDETSGLQWLSSTQMTANVTWGISADGTTIAGSYGNYMVEGDNTQAGIWRAGEGWTKLGALPTTLDCPTQSGGYDITADGKTITGIAWDGCTATAFRWTESEGMMPLQLLANGGNRATAIARDGSMIAGFAQGQSGRTPAVWFADGTGMVMNPNWAGEFQDVNADGTLAAGEIYYEAAVWSPVDGQRFLGSLKPAPNPSQSSVYAICGANDELLLGSDTDGGRTATVWTEETGWIKAYDYLVDLGVPVPEGTDLSWSFACSPDKRVLTGRVGAEQTWIAVIPEHLYEPAE